MSGTGGEPHRSRANGPRRDRVSKPPARPGASRLRCALLAWVGRFDLGEGVADQLQQGAVDIGEGFAGFFVLVEQTGHGEDVDRRLQACFRAFEQLAGRRLSRYSVALCGKRLACELGSSGMKRGDGSATGGLDVSFGLAMGQLLHKLVCG